MRKLVLVGLVGLVGCWTSSQSPPPRQAEVPSTGGDAGAGEPYGGATYGGVAYGGVAYGGVLTSLDSIGSPDFDHPNALGGLRGPSAPPTVSAGQPAAGAGLDKAIIRRYIQQNLPKIRFCYEQQLVANPTLEGTVTASFTIARDGRVSKSVASGLPVVDACVAGVIQAIAFPAPHGGGVVNVSYPFAFKFAE